MKKDIEQMVLTYKENPTPAGMEDILTAMEPLIKYWCQSQCYLPWEREDLQQVARIAVVGALERFDPEKEIRFKTFAYRTVSGKIMNYYRDNTWRVVIPRKYRELSTRITRAEGEYYQKHGNPPTTEQLAELLHADKAAIARRTKNLEGKGYLTREDAPNDRRSQLLFPTEKAESLKSSKAGIEAAFYEYLTSVLTEEEAAAFAASLNKLYTVSKTESRAGFPHFRNAAGGETTDEK